MKNVTKRCKTQNALACIAYFLNAPKKRYNMKAFTELQFEFCAPVWMLHCRQTTQ